MKERTWHSPHITIGRNHWRYRIWTDGKSMLAGFDYRPIEYARGYGDQWASARDYAGTVPIDQLNQMKQEHAAVTKALHPFRSAAA